MEQDVHSIRHLLAALDSKDTSIAEDAQHDLEALGAKAVGPLMGTLSSFGVFGQRCALDLLTTWPPEIIKEGPHASIENAVVPLLGSEDTVVRTWAAEALHHTRTLNAAPSILEALERAKQSGVAPDDSEAVAFRSALTALGARDEVVPDLLTKLVRTDEGVGRCWPADRIRELVEALADQSQVLLYFQTWTSREGRPYWTDSPDLAIDLEGPWHDVVRRARERCLQAVESWTAPSDAVVTLEWIAEADR